jgi:hypothetical protein
MATRVVLLDSTGEIVPLADGTNGDVLTYSGNAASWSIPSVAAPADFGGRFSGSPAANAVLFSLPMSRAGSVSTTAADHWFYADALPASGSVSISVKRLPYNSSTKVTVLTATWTSSDTAAANGLYKASIASVANETISEGDIVTVEMGGTANASFSTPQFIVRATLT